MGRRRVLAVVGVAGILAVTGLPGLWACSPDAPQSSDGPTTQGSNDGGLDPNDGAHSGTRLKLTWYQFTDGTKQFSGMYDAQTKELCSPYYGPWQDGHIYCVPPVGGQVVYTDAGCNAKALRYYVDTVCPQPVPPYYLERATVGCQARPAHLYVRGGPLAPAKYYVKNTSGTCGSAVASQSYDAFYTYGAEVATSELAELTLSAPAGAGRVGVRYYESSDGMRFPWMLHDGQLGADCAAEYYSDASSAARCVPDDARYAFYAHDALCTQPALSLAASCTAPAYAYTFPATSCPDDSETYYPVGTQLPASPLYYPSGPICVATTAASGTTYFGLGASVTPAPLTYAADSGSAHRIQLIHYTTPEGTRFRDPYKLYDSAKNTACYPETLPDGTIRCVADGGYIDTYYASSACTTQVDVVEIYKGPGTCAAPVVPHYARKDVAPQPGTCAYSTEVHAITTPHAGNVYTGSPGNCSLYTPYEGTLFDVGPVVPLTDFVSAALTMDN